MEFIFLGTSSGVPSLQRNVSGLAIKRRNTKAWCLVDCGEGTQHQLLKTDLSLRQLAAILITHVHGDHTYGLPGLLASASMAGRSEPLTIVGPPGVEAFVRAAMQHTDVYQNYELIFRDPGDDIGGLLGEDFHLASHPLSHRVPSFGYSFLSHNASNKLDAEKLRRHQIPEGPLWGEIARGNNVSLPGGEMLIAKDFMLPPKASQTIIVGGDNDSPDLLAEPAASAAVLIHEATYTQAVKDKVGPGPQHSSARDVAVFAERAQVANLVLTHFSARYHRPIHEGLTPLSEVEDEARAHYSGNLFLADDLAHYQLTDDERLTTVVTGKKKPA